MAYKGDRLAQKQQSISDLLERFEYIYYMMLGAMIEQDPTIENAFAPESECDKLYSDAYAARERITMALGIPSGYTDDVDNPDALIIVNAYEKMQKILCEHCYQQGYLDAKTDNVFDKTDR